MVAILSGKKSMRIISQNTYESLSNYQRSFLNGFIKSMFTKEVEVQEILIDKVSIRSTTGLASALLLGMKQLIQKMQLRSSNGF